MAKRTAKKRVSTTPSPTQAERLAKALQKRSKAELAALLVELAEDDRSLMRRLEAQFGVEAPSKDLIAATRQAIADATAFDEREINYNFDYDYEAYAAIQRNFARLIEQGELRPVMDLALELMSRGSYQVEMSDEGLMTEDIEPCLRIVVQAVRDSGLPAQDIAAWSAAMTKNDRVGFLCDKELQSLSEQSSKSRPRKR